MKKKKKNSLILHLIKMLTLRIRYLSLNTKINTKRVDKSNNTKNKNTEN